MIHIFFFTLFSSVFRFGRLELLLCGKTKTEHRITVEIGDFDALDTKFIIQPPKILSKSFNQSCWIRLRLRSHPEMNHSKGTFHQLSIKSQRMSDEQHHPTSKRKYETETWSSTTSMNSYISTFRFESKTSNRSREWSEHNKKMITNQLWIRRLYTLTLRRFTCRGFRALRRAVWLSNVNQRC